LAVLFFLFSPPAALTFLFSFSFSRSEPGHHHKTGQQMVAAVNPYLQQLVDELAEAYDRDGLDAFGLYVFGTILRAAAAPSRPQSLVVPRGCPSAPAVLMESLLRFPCNWSAWLELAECAGAGRDGVEREIEATLQPVLASHFCYALFCAHLQSEHHQAHHEALGLYERWLDPTLLGGSPYLQTQYGVVHYHLRQFDVAKRVLQEVHSSMPYRLEGMDVYSNILYVQQDSVALSQLAHAATVVDKYRPETCCIVGNYYSVKQMRAKAILYFQRALKLDPSFTSAWTLMGHEYVEWKQTAHAIECYRRAVQADAGDYRAWYGLGQTYEFLNMPLFSLFYYKRAVQLRPYDARMWCAVGTTLASLHRRPDAIRAYERAVQTGDTEGVATQKLAALYRNDGDAEKAARCYLRHLELRHHATHPNAAAAAAVASSSSGPAMPSLSSSSGAGATLSLEQMLQGLAVEATEAEAILYLANYHKNNNEFAVATVLCTRLLEYPGPEKEEAKAMLRELRSISSFPAKRRVRPSAAAAAGGAGSHPASRGHGGDRPPPPSGSLFG
jgi:anaphase-promoting complex subunit 8